MINITIETNQIGRVLTGLAKGLADCKEPLTDSAMMLLEEIDENFEKQGALYAGKWQKLKPLTIQIRDQEKRDGLSKFGGAEPILQRTQRLRYGFDFDANSKRMEIFNNARSRETGEEYFSIHQLGKGKIAQRVMMQINDKNTSKIAKIFIDYLIRIIQ